jgi:hypothetical protein
MGIAPPGGDGLTGERMIGLDEQRQNDLVDRAGDHQPIGTDLQIHRQLP